jgi:hypothetical protein
VVLGILLFSQDAQWPDDSMLNPANFQLLRRKIAIRILKTSWVADSSTTSLVPEVLDLTADSLAADSSTDIIAITRPFLVIPTHGLADQVKKVLQVSFFHFFWHELEDADLTAISAYATIIKNIVEGKTTMKNIVLGKEEQRQRNKKLASTNYSFVNKHAVSAFVEKLAKLTVTNGQITTRELKSIRATILVNAQKFELRYSCVLFEKLHTVFEGQKWTPSCINFKELAETLKEV